MRYQCKLVWIEKLKILILGSTGLLGNTLIKYFFNKSKYQTFGLIRDPSKIDLFDKKNCKNFFILKDIIDFLGLEKIINNLKPNVIINCIGLNNKIDQRDYFNMEKYILINSLFPHKLQAICSKSEIRLIHFSSDCVFSGKKGNYSEIDLPDPIDFYGKSKLMGEINYGNSLTIRKSIIGHELFTKEGLLEWFLSKNGKVEGYQKAIFSGLTVLELAKIIDKFILPNDNLNGIVHISGYPISKYDLLKIISSTYSKSIKVIPNDVFNINRALDSSHFNTLTGYHCKPWPLLIKSMYEFNLLKQ